MPDGAAPPASGRIGPNALIQLVAPLDDILGTPARHRLFAAAGVPQVPDGSQMIPEDSVAAVHQMLRLKYPAQAPALLCRAGQGTGDYILAHRIPRPAQTLLRNMPRRLAARLLTRAILAHGWTFCGSGTLSAQPGRPSVFEVAGNPVVRGEHAPAPICIWHAAVFERLFRALVHPSATAHETTCCATGAAACRFEIAWP